MKFWAVREHSKTCIRNELHLVDWEATLEWLQDVEGLTEDEIDEVRQDVATMVERITRRML